MSRSVMGRVIDSVMRKAGGLETASTGSHPEHAPLVELDVRDELRGGREPFSRIMKAVSALDDGEVLRVRAIFEPVPLLVLMSKRGFAHETEMHAADDWSVWFWRAAPASAGGPAPRPSLEVDDRPADDVPADDERTVQLDVRGLEPPEPMTRTLIALESLDRGRTLVQINSRVPQFLLPLLAERGFAWEIDETRSDRVLVRISHAQ